jgi:hypothetical protein
MNKRVFISSTFQDLKDYRTAIQEIIRQIGAKDISMEYFGARDERPKQECIRIVSEESDLFVGVYAYRYGFVPDGDAISISEAEYEAATIANIPRFIYLLDEDVPWLPKYIDTDQPAQKLEQFKKKLKANHICKFYSNKDNLASYVAADLGRHFSLLEIKRVDDPAINQSTQNLATAEEWEKFRNGIYDNNRGVFLTHVVEPSKRKNQQYDIFIYLMRHQSSDLLDIECAEFFFGHMWHNKIYKVENTGGFIGIIPSAYGEFLCTCRVTFTDGYQINIHRYIDFEAGKVNR